MRSSTRLQSDRSPTNEEAFGRESHTDFSRFNEELEDMVHYRTRELERKRQPSARLLKT